MSAAETDDIGPRSRNSFINAAYACRLAYDSTFSLGTRIFNKLAGRTLSKDLD